MWKLLCKIPIAGHYLLIANAYAYGAAPEFVVRAAPLRKWLARVLWKPIFCFAAAYLISSAFDLPSGNDFVGPAKDVVSVFPNLLGFAVALYGLIFAVPMQFWRALRARSARLKFEPETINADFAFPVLSLVYLLAAAWLLSILGQSFRQTWVMGTFLFLYGIALLSEIVTLIFFTADRILRDDKKVHGKGLDQ